jgi:hypothetical protein
MSTLIFVCSGCTFRQSFDEEGPPRSYLLRDADDGNFARYPVQQRHAWCRAEKRIVSAEELPTLASLRAEETRIAESGEDLFDEVTGLSTPFATLLRRARAHVSWRERRDAEGSTERCLSCGSDRIVLAPNFFEADSDRAPFDHPDCPGRSGHGNGNGNGQIRVEGYVFWHANWRGGTVLDPDGVEMPLTSEDYARSPAWHLAAYSFDRFFREPIDDGALKAALHSIVIAKGTPRDDLVTSVDRVLLTEVGLVIAGWSHFLPYEHPSTEVDEKERVARAIEEYRAALIEVTHRRDTGADVGQMDKESPTTKLFKQFLPDTRECFPRAPDSSAQGPDPDSLAGWLLFRRTAFLRDATRSDGETKLVIERVRRDSHRVYIDRVERRLRDAARADAMVVAMDACRTSVANRAPLTFANLREWQSIVLGREGVVGHTASTLSTLLDDAADPTVPIYLRAARAYLDVQFLQPFETANDVAARLALDHVLASEGLSLHAAEPLFELETTLLDVGAACRFREVLAYLVGSIGA